MGEVSHRHNHRRLSLHQSQTLEAMQKELLNDGDGGSTARLACKLLEAHAANLEAEFFCDAALRDAEGENTEARVYHLAEAYSLLTSAEFLVESPTPDGEVSVGNGRVVHVPFYGFTREARQRLRL